MASTKQALVARLQSQPAVVALLGQPPDTRLYPADAVPADAGFPRLTYSDAAEARTKLLGGGYAGDGRATFELLCWAEGNARGYAVADELAAAVRDALDGERWTALGVTVQYGSIEDGADAGEPPQQGESLGNACARLEYRMFFVE